MRFIQGHGNRMRSSIPVQGASFHSPDAMPGLMAPPKNLRAALFAFGVLLALGGGWNLVPQILSPRDIGLASDREAAMALESDFPRALWAARTAQIRGDLWASAAFAESSLLWLDRSAPLSGAALERVQRARANAEAALALAPINGGAWLFLSALPSGSADPNDAARVATLLEMSYFTAPSDVDIAPRRLERAAASGALSDPDLREFVKGDIRVLLAGRPPLTRPIIAAYRNASPQNQPIFGSLVMDVDPVFGQSLRSGSTK
ncbi:hypothetical protein SAMN05444581_11835 [Methylocapsa palsarum]|uniref:Uncharacterized protein n=2 Tax=Methylocapsa palsarum TaxID=1612308 RepID=A0A1I4C6S3_9HYPH|nr:hypothetical protein SAMN05444581_11835 [Methylocapsa palsarum]